MVITPLDVQQNDKQMKGRLQDGQLDGALQIKDDGRKQADLNYSAGELQGMSLLYHPNGKISAQMPFVRDKMQGVASFYSPEGWLQRKATYRRGLLHGEAFNYFPDGQIAEAELYRDGVREGRYQRFHPNGKQAVDARYLNGQLMEPERGFAEDGRPLGADGKPISRVRWWYQKWADPQQV